MIKFKNGCEISDFCIDSSFGLSGGGLFPYTLLPEYRKLMRDVVETKTTIFAKSATFQKRNGNFHIRRPWTWKYVRRIEHYSMLNAYGLTNPGVHECAKMIKDAISRGFNVIPNYYADFSKGRDWAIEEAFSAIDTYRMILGRSFKVLLKNDSCPNSGEDIEKTIEDNIALTRAIKERVGDEIALVEKISYIHPYKMARELVRNGADAIMAINAIPYQVVFPGRMSPLEKVGGGAVSGVKISMLARTYHLELTRSIDVPIIYSGGIMTSLHVTSCKKFAREGKSSLAACSLAVLNTKEARRIIKEENRK
jgi:dihydroorotate dehydrogenase